MDLTDRLHEASGGRFQKVTLKAYTGTVNKRVSDVRFEMEIVPQRHCGNE